MANILCFYRDSYFIWSTMVDAPSTFGMTEAECVEWLSWQNNIPGFGYAAEAIARANKFGTNSDVITLEDINSWNRAGPGESPISLDDIYTIYCSENRQYTQDNV